MHSLRSLKSLNTLFTQNNSAFSKIVSSAAEAVKGIKSGSVVLVGGYGVCGVPNELIKAVQDSGVDNLTVVSNNAGIPSYGLGPLLRTNQVKKLVASYIGENPELEKKYLGGEIELEFVPQGTLAEKFRAKGHGIPAFYTSTGTKTVLESGGYPVKYKKGTTEPEIFSIAKERRNFHGKEYLLEEAISGDVSLVKAQKADTYGNLYFSRTARNFNVDMAQASKLVIAEVEEIVQNGDIDSDVVHVPGLFVDRIYKSQKNEKPLEKPNCSSSCHKKSHHHETLSVAQKKILTRVAKEVVNGSYINLGFGLPSNLLQFTPKDVKVEVLSENGYLGSGVHPTPGQENPDVVNSLSEAVTLLPGTSVFPSSLSFGMIRGGFLNLIVVDALQVSSTGDLANWNIPGKQVHGIGSAMDLAISGSKIVVAMEHTANGKSKLVGSCNLPISGQGIVNKVVTEKAVFELQDGQLVLTEIATESSLEDIKANTKFEFKVVANPARF